MNTNKLNNTTVISPTINTRKCRLSSKFGNSVEDIDSRSPNNLDNDDKYVLKIFIDSTDNELIKKYKNAVENHNNFDQFYDSGFDVFTPIMDNSNTENYRKVFREEYKIKIDTNLKCAMYKWSQSNQIFLPCGFYMYPRSSISKTPLRLSNNIGIIDSGYRGNLIGIFDNLYFGLSDESYELIEPKNYIIKPYDRFLQICSGNLEYFKVELVNKKEDLQVTSRGEGGFGSTGR